MIKVDEIEDVYKQMERDNKSRNDLYAKIDEAVACEFKPDEAIANLPFIQGRSFALPDISDAKNAGTRAFTALLPNINIQATSDNQGEYERVDKMESAWDWEMQRMNRPINGEKGIHDQIVDSAMTYHAVALQTEYLPYKFKDKKNDPRIKSMLRRKCFNWSLHNPSSVYSLFSKYGMERVIKFGRYTAQRLIDEYGLENAGVKQMLSELKNPSRDDLLKIEFDFRDYTDWKNRVIYAKPVGKSTKAYEFENAEHGLPFISWVIVDYGDPLWKAIIQSGHWRNLQHMRLIRFSKSVAQAGKPEFVITTADGTMKGVWIDWKNPLNPMIKPAGSDLQELRPNTLDPQFEAEYQEERSDVSRSTVSRVLQDPSGYINAPFSTLSATINMTLGQLTPAKRTAESAISEAIYQGFEWIKFSKIPFASYRNKDKDSKMDDGSAYQRGEQIIISHQTAPTEEELSKMNEKEQRLQQSTVYFDLEALYIDVQLQSANMTDEQARLNVLINAKDKLGMSEQEAWEKMGWRNYKQNQIQTANETLLKAEIQKMVELKMLEVQQAQMQMQQQAQQEMMAQQQAQMQQQQGQAVQSQINDLNAANQYTTIQGADMRGGGNPAALAAPQETRESITGQARNGEQIA